MDKNVKSLLDLELHKNEDLFLFIPEGLSENMRICKRCLRIQNT